MSLSTCTVISALSLSAAISESYFGNLLQTHGLYSNSVYTMPSNVLLGIGSSIYQSSSDYKYLLS